MGLQLIPTTIRGAKRFIAEHHRHHKPPVGALFAVGCGNGDSLAGVATVGRPVARGLQDGWTAEVTRLATDGSRNACSMLYAACWRACRALGYRRLVTYILETEPGVSLRAAGWKLVAQTKGGSWDCKSRPRVDKHPTCPKQRWQMELPLYESPYKEWSGDPGEPFHPDWKYLRSGNTATTEEE